MVHARQLTREEKSILRGAVRDCVEIISSEYPRGGVIGDMQDGILAYYLGQAVHADANVEAKIDKEPVDFRELLKGRRP